MTPAAPRPRSGLAAWARWPTALLVALVVLAAGLGLPPTASPHDWEPGYAAADGRAADVAAFDVDPGAFPGQPRAPFFELPSCSRTHVVRGPAATRAPLPPRDRSPPAR